MIQEGHEIQVQRTTHGFIVAFPHELFTSPDRSSSIGTRTKRSPVTAADASSPSVCCSRCDTNAMIEWED